MTIMEALEQTARLKPHQYDTDVLIRWLSELDEKIYEEIWKTHEGELPEFSGYGEETPGETALLVAGRYADMYIKYLESQIDYQNEEYDRYNNSAAAFNALYMEYWAWYTRTHMPKQENRVKGVFACCHTCKGLQSSGK